MTTPEAVRAARGWWLPSFLGLALVGVAVNFTLLLPALHRQAIQSHEGQLARARQRATYPVSLKVYEDAERRGVISARDLACFKSASNCFRPMRVPHP